MQQLDIFKDVFESDVKNPILNTPLEPVTPVIISYEDFDYDTLNLYAGIDCIATTEILRKQFPEIIKQAPLAVMPSEAGKPAATVAPAIIESFSELEIPAQEFLIDLEINGMKYSIPRNAWISEKMTEEVAKLDEKIFSAVGKKLDLNSGKKIAEFLYGEKGFTPPNFTKVGASY